MIFPAARLDPPLDLGTVQELTHEYASFSQRRSGLGHVLGAAAALVVWIANGVVGPGGLTVSLTIAVTLIWLVGKEIIRHRLYQPFGDAREHWQAPDRRIHVVSVTAASVILAIVFAAVAGIEAWRVTHGSPPNVRMLAYLAILAILPWIAWRYLRTPYELVIGVLMLCACAVTSAGSAYPLWGALTMLPLFAIALVVLGLQEHRQFQALAARLRARAGARP